MPPTIHQQRDDEEQEPPPPPPPLMPPTIHQQRDDEEQEQTQQEQQQQQQQQSRLEKQEEKQHIPRGGNLFRRSMAVTKERLGLGLLGTDVQKMTLKDRIVFVGPTDPAATSEERVNEWV
ncbi:hypothetical protein AJ78_08820 [Emergomyces pasteurianus Ep9510]|uniref:Uncharacterized protein n=1 Tax=Emergomyces pasteurianus Ep9510 TaxID=1447872 RepID=A0A1J9P1A9_9EURO|nr:hypothetical protein AJ78_08820 [Emergomyces pasteurianus Ep9510]